VTEQPLDSLRSLGENGPPPHPPRELIAVAAITAALAVAVGFMPQGGEGTLLKALRPTLWVLAWIAPAWLALERRKKDPLHALAIGVRPRDPVACAVALATLPVYALAFVLRPGFHRPAIDAWSLPTQLLFVALPEEVFFRGTLQPSLPVKKPWIAILITSAVFALAHLAKVQDPTRLLVFFPSLLFGWLRLRTGSVIPGVVFHALCNFLDEHVRRGLV
jgi:membrane protease YdiL (CAAX protease family)